MTNLLKIISIALALTACAAGQRAAELNEKRADILFDAGVAALEEGRTTDALNSFRESAKYGPNRPATWNNLGLAYYGKGENALAEESWKKALTLEKGFSDARNNLGVFYLKNKRFKEAEVEFKKVTADIYYPKVYQTYFNLGQLNLHLGKPLSAEQNFNLSLKENPKFCPSWYQLAILQKQKGELSAAEQSFRNSISGVCFNNPQAHFEIGEIYLKQRNYPQAKVKLLEVIELFPRSDWAKKAELSLNTIK